MADAVDEQVIEGGGSPERKQWNGLIPVPVATMTKSVAQARPVVSVMTGKKPVCSSLTCRGDRPASFRWRRVSEAAHAPTFADEDLQVVVSSGVE